MADPQQSVYDQALNAPPPSTTPQTQPVTSVYDNILDQQGNQQLMQAIAGAAGKNPNVEGEAQRLGFETGVGPDIARRNMDELRRRQTINGAQNRNLTVTSPILARQLSDPNFAAISHDQLDNLTTTEKIFNWIKSQDAEAHDLPGAWTDVSNQWKTGALGYERSLLGWKAMAGKAGADDWARISDIDQQLQTLGAPKTATGTLSNFAGQFLPVVSHSLTVGAASGIATGATAGALGAATGPGDLVIAPGAAALGFTGGFTSTMALEGVQQAAGQSYLDMMKRGIDPHTALIASSGVGLINGALQMGVLRIIGRPVSEAVSESISKAVGDELSGRLVRPTVGKAVSSMVFGAMGRSAAGGVDMAAQDFVSQIGGDLANSYDKGKLETALQTPEGRQQLASHMADAFMNGALITGAMGGAGEMLKLHSDLSRAQDATRSQQFFQALSENAADSEVRKRNPDAYENFIAAQAEGTSADTTYIDGQKMAELLHQTGVDPVAVEKMMPGFGKQLVEAQATGGDVEIPTAKFAAHLAGTDLGNAMTEHIRLDPSAMTPAEGKEYSAHVEQMVTEAKAKAGEQIATNAEFAKSATKVENNIFDQLKTTKSMPDDVARTNAKMFGSMISSIAAEKGITPEEAFEQYQTHVMKAGDTVGALHQTDVRSPEYKQWFGESKGVDPNDPNILHQDVTAGTYEGTRRGRTLTGSEGSNGEGNRGTGDQADTGRGTGSAVGGIRGVPGPGEVTDARGSIDPERFGQRIARAISDPGTGPKPDAEVALPPTSSILYQAQNLPEWKDNIQTWMKKNGYTAAEIKRHIAAIDGQMKIFSALGPVQLEMLPRGAGENEGKGPLRKNVDPIYKVSFDASANCIKRVEAAATVNYIQNALRTLRPENPVLTSSERVALISMFKAAGKQAPCLYCYVEAPRGKVSDMVGKSLDVAFGAEPPNGWKENARELGSEAAAYVQKHGVSKGDIDVNVVLDPDYAASPAGQAKLAEHPELYSYLTKTARFVTNANKVKRYEEYSGQILRTPDATIKELNGYAGFRFFSSSDFQPEHVVDLMQAFHDLVLRDAKSHAYTKVPDYADIFGETGQKIQTSIFAKHDPATGQIVMDDWQGMHWDDAKRLRAAHANVGTVLVGTTPEIIAWGKQQPWVDYIIPYHASGLELPYQEAMGWADFSSTQHESRIDGSAIPADQMIRMHDLKVSKGISDEELTRRYLTLAMKRGQVPVFPQFMFKDYVPQHSVEGMTQEVLASNPETEKAIRRQEANAAEARWIQMVENKKIEWDQIDPSYGKLKKDFARTDTPFNAIKPSFDMEKAGDVLNRYFRGETPVAGKPDTEIGDAMIQRLQAGDTGANIGADMLVQIRKGRELLHQAQPAQPLGENRGGFDPITRNILLGDKSDFSTFAHETGHYYLSVLSEMSREADASDRTKGDFDTLMKWFGTTGDQWKQWDDELKQTGKVNPEQAKFHEQFAYSFEKYLADGKAPTEELQGVFDRFSRWLKRAYQNVSDSIGAIYKQQHGVDLPETNNEVKQVMDRMLASDEQIKQAEAQRHMTPLFEKKPDSMTDDEWAAYQKLGNEASDESASKLSAASIRQMQWLSRAKSRALKELQKQHDALRADTREDVAKEVAQDRVRQASEWLKNGRMEDPKTGEAIEALEGHKLDRAAVESMYPESGLGERPDMSKLRGMLTDEGGMHPDLAAEMFGFDNGDQLVRQIADAKPIDEEIDARTDQRMLERHGEMNTPEAMNDQVNRALHNDARQRFVAVELRHLQQATTPVRVMTQAAEVAAKRMIEDKPIGEIRPYDYSVAETRAARAAEDAMKKGDSAGAIKAKRDQLLQHALAKAAAAAQDETQKTLKYLGRFEKPKLEMAKKIGADYLDRINELLAGYQLAVRAKLGEGREDISSWVRSEYDRTGIMPAVSDDVISTMGRMHWKNMNLGQLRDLRDAVKSLDYIGRRQGRIEIEGEAREVADLVADVARNLADVKHTEPIDLRLDLAHAKGLNKIAAQFLSLKSKVRGMDAALLKMEQFFQWLDAGEDAGLKEAPVDGPMQSVFHLASNAEGKERAMRAESAAAIRELGEKLKDSKVNLNDVLDVPEMPRRGRGTRWYREELIAAALNMGNESNKQKLLEGYQWQEPHVVGAINRLLSPAEMDFVQGVWHHIGSYANDIKELQRRQTGITPQMIEATPLSTDHGTYPGGYYPVVYDDFQDSNIERKNAQNADKLFENNYARPATAKGHTIERTGYKGPIYLSLGVISRHLDQVTHDLAWREPIADMNKVLSDERLRDEINQTYGKEYSAQLRPWLQAMANDKVFNTAGDSAWEKFYRGARTNATMVGIGFRLSTMEVHGLSALSNSLGEVGAKWFLKGAAQFAGFDRIQATRDFVYERSPEMANRMNTIDRNIHEAVDQVNRREDALVSPGAATRVLDGARTFSMMGVSMIDMASAMPTWMGAYLKGMAHAADGGLDMSEADAIEYANRSVRNAHGGGGVKDLAAVQRSKGVMSLATMFYSFWNHMYNRQRDLGKGWGDVTTGNASVRDMPRLLARSWYYFVVPQLIHAMVKGGSSKDDDGSLAGFCEHLAKEMGLGFVSGVPVLRDLASACVNGRDYTITPLEQAGKAIVTAAEDATHWGEGAPTSKHAPENAAQAVGYTFGIPTAQPATTTRFIWDVLNGQQDPQDLADWWKGVTTGKIR